MSEPAISLDDAGYQNLRALADRLLETTRVEYVDEGVLLIMNPPGIERRRIVRAIADDAKRAFYTGTVTVNWATDENYQWDLPDSSGRFYIPDVTFIHPGATTAEKERAAIALVSAVAARSGDASARSLADYAWVPVEATRNCAAGRPGLGLQRLVRPGVEDQWLQVWTVYQRDDLTEDDQVIASAMRLPQPAVERRCRVGQHRAAGCAWLEGYAVEHCRADRAVPVSEPAREVLLSGGEHVDDERPGALDQADAAAGLSETDQHQHRVERHRREGVDRHAVHVAVIGGHGDDGDSGRERAHHLAESAHAAGRGGQRVPSLSGPGGAHGGSHQAVIGSRPASVDATGSASVSVRINSGTSDRISRTSRQILRWPQPGISTLAAP